MFQDRNGQLGQGTCHFPFIPSQGVGRVYDGPERAQLRFGVRADLQSRGKCPLAFVLRLSPVLLISRPPGVSPHLSTGALCALG